MTESRIEARIRELGYELPVAARPRRRLRSRGDLRLLRVHLRPAAFVDGVLPATGKAPAPVKRAS